MRLSEVKTVNWPAGKRVIAGGTNPTQNGQQRTTKPPAAEPQYLQIYAICAT